MGFRTVVVLNNDQAHEWAKDSELGKRITRAASYAGMGDHLSSLAHQALPYGEVVQSVHADNQSIIACDGYSGEVVAGTLWYKGQTAADKQLQLLRAHAEALGYRISKKPRQVAQVGSVRTLMQD